MQKATKKHKQALETPIRLSKKGAAAAAAGSPNKENVDRSNAMDVADANLDTTAARPTRSRKVTTYVSKEEESHIKASRLVLCFDAVC